MRIAFIFALILITYACKQETIEDKQEIIGPKKEIDKGEMETLVPLTTKITIEDLIGEYCLVMDLKNDTLKGISNKPSESTSEANVLLIPQTTHIYPDEKKLPLGSWDDSTIIPFVKSEDEILLTMWTKSSKDSIVFQKIIHPSIDKLYSYISSIDTVNHLNENYLLIYIKGGEGGDNWDQQIIAQIDPFGQLKTITRGEVGYCHDCGNWAKISVKKTKRGFKMIEIRDSMTLFNETWNRTSRKINELSSIEL